jgi:hypothetical protein
MSIAKNAALRQRSAAKSESILSSVISKQPSSELLLSSSSSSLSCDDANKATEPKTFLSLEERAKVPNSFYVVLFSILLLQYCSGMWSMDVIHSLLNSYSKSAKSAGHLAGKAFKTLANPSDALETAQTIFALACVFLLAYVFIIAPARAGLWTLAKARKHKSHRDMGLFFLTQYFLAWVEFSTNYHGENGIAGASYIPHAVALNGTSY